MEDHEVGVVRAGHEPLLAVQDVLAGGRVPDGGRRHRPGVRAGVLLGDRVAAVPLAPNSTGRGSGCAGPGRSGAGRCRRPGCTTTGRRSPGRTARGRSPAPSPTSPGHRRSAGSEPACSLASIAARRNVVGDRAGQDAVVPLELRLVRLEHVDGVAPGSLAKCLELGRQGEVHGSMVARRSRPRAVRRGRWDAPWVPARGALARLGESGPPGARPDSGNPGLDITPILRRLGGQGGQRRMRTCDPVCLPFRSMPVIFRTLAGRDPAQALEKRAG